MPVAQPAPAPQQQPAPSSQPRLDVSGAPEATPNAEPTNPKLLGMEIPLLDPSSDTVSYNGGKFDVGNNAVVRAKFETYLHGTPDTSEETSLYSKKLEKILQYVRKHYRSQSSIGSEALVQIGKTLHSLSEVPTDGGNAGVLASCIVNALDAQRANRTRKIENSKLNKELDSLARATNNLNKSKSASNSYLVAYNTKKIAQGQAEQAKNAATNVQSELAAKVSYQSNMVAFLFMRRYDHAVIASRVYRHVFHDGDNTMKIEKDSKADQFLKSTTGLPPTVNTVDALATEARTSVDKHMEAVHSMLAQNKLGEATQHLIEAVALGEHMISVLTFPVEGRRRVAEYWTLRKRALSALNARDYAMVDEIAGKMKALDVDFDDSMLLSYSAGKKRQSDLCIRNARKALMAGDDEEFNRCITEAGTIWPLNPNLDASAKHLQEFDNNSSVLAEFRTLYGRCEYRTIFKEQERFECVALDPELKAQYKEVILVISTIDAMLKQLESVAEQDRVMGPCIAYEKLVEYRTTEPRCAEDPGYKDALNMYAQKAHDFVQALRDAEECEKRREFGSALSNYYRALCLYPKSTLAGQGASKVSEIIVNAQY
ncbi:MAG: hypothetical protein II349_01585 [Akkermansia sp.]|nr:hypothetical protein [Akkermansia sp.]